MELPSAVKENLSRKPSKCVSYVFAAAGGTKDFWEGLEVYLYGMY